MLSHLTMQITPEIPAEAPEATLERDLVCKLGQEHGLAGCNKIHRLPAGDLLHPANPCSKMNRSTPLSPPYRKTISRPWIRRSPVPSAPRSQASGLLGDRLGSVAAQRPSCADWMRIAKLQPPRYPLPISLNLCQVHENTRGSRHGAREPVRRRVKKTLQEMYRFSLTTLHNTPLQDIMRHSFHSGRKKCPTLKRLARQAVAWQYLSTATMRRLP
jgi:hypothetical protein